MTDYSLDHVIFMVKDPADWTRRLAACGINAVLRDEGPGSDKHMLAVFEGCSYMEVIRRPARPEDAHLPWEGRLSALGEGFGGFCLAVSDLDEAMSALYGSKEQERAEFGNTVIDRGDWWVQHGAPAQHQDITTPFLLHSTKGRNLRAPITDSMPHASGLTRLAGITLAMDDLSAFDAFYGQQFLLSDAAALDWSDGSGRAAEIGGQWVAAYRPLAGTQSAQTMLRRGSGPVEVTLAKGEARPGDGALIPDLSPLGIRVA